MSGRRRSSERTKTRQRRSSLPLPDTTSSLSDVDSSDLESRREIRRASVPDLSTLPGGVRNSPSDVGKSGKTKRSDGTRRRLSTSIIDSSSSQNAVDSSELDSSRRDRRASISDISSLRDANTTSNSELSQRDKNRAERWGTKDKPYVNVEKIRTTIAKENGLVPGWNKLRLGIESYNRFGESVLDRLDTLESLSKEALDIIEAIDNNQTLQKEARDEIATELRAIRQNMDLEMDNLRYAIQKEVTTEAFSNGNAPKYLHITPVQGSKTGLANRWKTTIPLDQQFRATLPEGADQGDIDLDITPDQQPVTERVVETLVISGGHGGDGELFETENGSHFLLRWWESQAKKLADKGLRAKVIVLDACMTATMIPAFKDLLTDDGVIIGYTQSTPRAIFTSDFWDTLNNTAPQDIPALINQRLTQHAQEVQGTHNANSQALQQTSPLGDVMPIALYSKDKDETWYDGNATSKSTIANLDEENKKEVENIKQSLQFQGAIPKADFVPSLNFDQGSEFIDPDANPAQIKTLQDLINEGRWVDDIAEALDVNSPIPTEIYDQNDGFRKYNVTVESQGNTNLDTRLKITEAV